MSYKIYRPKGTIRAQVVEEDMRIPLGGGEFLNVAKGAYQIRNEDGSVEFKSKEEFERDNEPVRRPKGQAETKPKSKPKGKSAPATS